MQYIIEKWKNGERWGKIGENGGTWGGGGMGWDIDLGLLCYFLSHIVFCFSQEHHPSWLGMGMDIVWCPLLS